jgi:peptidoglycan/LPS O-acetylase OafA/YrhL
LRFIGRYSYGLYLWHELPGHVFERWIVDAQLAIAPRWVSGPAATFVLFGFCLLVAMASYHAVELPFLRLKRYFSYDAAGLDRSLPSRSESIDLRVPQSSL